MYEDFDPNDPSLYEEDESVSDETTNKRSSWMRTVIIWGITLMLVGNILAFWPQVYNWNSIQFLVKNNILSAEAHIQQYKEAVVIIKSGDSKGTGFNVHADGLIITNEHVVNKVTNHLVSFANGKTYKAKTVATVPTLDTAILQLQLDDEQISLPTLPLDLQFNSSQESSLASTAIYVVGNPLFFSHIANEGSLIGKTLTSSLESYALLIDAPIYKGNSGSPLINEEGKVIGVVFATTKMSINQKKTNVGLAIPIDQILQHQQLQPILLP